MPAYMSGILPKGHSVSVDGGSVSKSAGGPPPQGSPVAKQPGVPPPEHLLRNKRKRDDEATVDGASGAGGASGSDSLPTTPTRGPLPEATLMVQAVNAQDPDDMPMNRPHAHYGRRMPSRSAEDAPQRTSVYDPVTGLVYTCDISALWQASGLTDLLRQVVRDVGIPEGSNGVWVPLQAHHFDL